MTVRTSRILVPIACCAMWLYTLVFIGCNRDSAVAEKSAPPVRDDAPYRSKLTGQVQVRNGVLKARAAVQEKISALLEQKKKALKTDDEAKAKAALAADPEWQSLLKRLADADQALVDNRAKTAEAIRGRMTGTEKGKEISK